ncbi:hypothetical protein GCM10027084_05430 [Pseudoxanthomonas sangjuensis]|uniref:2OG-Fe(II) oxygenase n=1 Tax=Pseudoxanthomonas sangjuensis TaxID=1503750 RepID=UPI001390A02D|nr:2OG-Fe(II) oxygenase [Pseudoxanthomonas sangjuensis]
MSAEYPFVFGKDFMADRVGELSAQFSASEPFRYIVIDDFLPYEHARFLSNRFPQPDHPVWLDWKKRSPHQYGKQGPGNSSKFHLLDPTLRFALYEFNTSPFLQFLEALTGIGKLIPDPHYTGGGMHQILRGGILDIHTDFNSYTRLDLHRQLNVLIYLNENWEPGYGGELELWDSSPKLGGKCIESIPPLFNRAVIFKTDKTSFHGHPREWAAPEPLTRRSIALYYYTVRKLEGARYDELTDFQGVNRKEIG